MKILFLEDVPLAKYGIGLSMEQKGIGVRYTRLCEAVDKGRIDEVYAEIAEYKPDFIFNMGMCCLKNRKLLFQVIETLKVKYIYWAIEDPVDMWLSKEHATHAVLTLTTAIESIPIYKKYNIDAKYMMFGCTKYFHKRGEYNSKFAHDIIFIGNNYSRHPTRLYGIKTILKPLMERGYDIKVFGNDWWFKQGESFILDRKFYGGYCSYEELKDACATAKIILGIHSVSNSSTMMSMRTFEVLACQGFYLTQYVPAVQRFFKNGEHLVWSKNSIDTIKLVNEYLPKSEKRMEISQKGQSECYKFHDYDSKVDMILKELKNKGLI